MRIVLALLFLGATFAAEPFEGFQFADGTPRTAADFAGQAVVVAYFCSH